MNYRKLTEIMPGDPLPVLLLVDSEVYVSVEQLCDRMGYSSRGEARTSWRSDTALSLPNGNKQSCYIRAEAAMRRLGRATLYGPTAQNAQEQHDLLMQEIHDAQTACGVPHQIFPTTWLKDGIA